MGYRNRRYLSAILLLALTACSDQPLPPVAESGELVVLTYRSPTTYYHNADEKPAGLEHDLVKLFAEELGVKYRFVTAGNFSQVLPLLVKHKAHLAAAGIPMGTENGNAILFGPPYQTAQLQLAYRSGRERPKGWQGVTYSRIAVPVQSRAVAELKQASKFVRGLHWIETDHQDTGDLLDKVASGDIDFTIADSHALDVARNFQPELAAAFDVGSPQKLAWAFPEDADPELIKRAHAFFTRITQDGTLQRLLDRYYGHVKRLGPIDVATFLQKKDAVLPRYKKLFHEAQRLTGIDWRFLAALAYQESHWNPLATSFTNVRGIMMLTEDTADQMNVSDRLDPRQSILAGAEYFLSLKDKLPQRIRDPDRTWMTIAIYNTGYGHVEDARVLAQRQGLNPDSWLDLKKTLPLLAKEEYALTVRNGFARGGEAVIMTENVRTYYDILTKFEPPLHNSPRHRWIERSWLEGLFGKDEAPARD
ncbi:MAG: membrane-bound lytic murein transglycosylase MltF [Pseudomonadota bacterium]